LGQKLEKLSGDNLKLITVGSRGTKVYPDGFADTLTSDSWICRFMGETEGAVVSHAQIISLLQRTKDAGFDFVKF